MAHRNPMVDEKLAQVPDILKEVGIDAWLLFARESHTLHDPCFDLVVGTNVTWQSAFVLTPQGDRIAIVGSLDRAATEMAGHYRDIVGYVGGVSGDLRKTLERLDPKRIAVNFSLDDVMSDGMTHGMYLTLVTALAGTPYADRLESSQRVVSALRGRKSATERARIKAACEATVRIYEALTPRLKAGLTEKQVAGFILEEMARDATLTLAWDPDHCPAVFTGPESAGAHAGPTDRRIEPGHIMNTDFGVKSDDYVSDLQRTWYFLREGETEAPGAVQHGFDTILESIRAGAAALKPGVKGGDVDAVARRCITDRGYPEFPHALGHQVGRTAHDGAGLLCPRWERYGNLPELLVEEHQCYTLEPRLPVEGHGIATCEEIVAVTATGCEYLSRPQEQLYLVGVRDNHSRSVFTARNNHSGSDFHLLHVGGRLAVRVHQRDARLAAEIEIRPDDASILRVLGHHFPHARRRCGGEPDFVRLPVSQSRSRPARRPGVLHIRRVDIEFVDLLAGLVLESEPNPA